VDLAGGFDKLGTALSAQNDSENALLQFNNELNIYQYLETREPGNLTWQQKAAQLLEQIGDLQFEQAKVSNQAGNTQQSVQQATAALGSYQKSLALREQLLHAAPEDVDAQLNAAHVLNQLGVALYWSRQGAVAANAFRQRVRLLENIIDTHHGTPQIQVQLIWALYALSLMSDNATEARDDLTKSLAIATELDNSHADPDEMVGVVGFLQGALAKLPTPSAPPTPPAPPKPPTSSKPN
jgi:tetratricopeptide (TPR) repeat protein